MKPKGTAPDNNGLHQTGREGAAASRPVVEARPAGEAGCYPGVSDATCLSQQPRVKNAAH